MPTPSLGKTHICNKTHPARKPMGNSQSFMALTHFDQSPLIHDCFLASGIAAAFAAFASSRQ